MLLPVCEFLVALSLLLVAVPDQCSSGRVLSPTDAATLRRESMLCSLVGQHCCMSLYISVTGFVRSFGGIADCLHTVIHAQVLLATL